MIIKLVSLLLLIIFITVIYIIIFYSYKKLILTQECNNLNYTTNVFKKSN